MFRSHPPFMTTATFAQLTAPSTSLKRASPSCPLDLQIDCHTNNSNPTTTPLLEANSSNETNDSAPQAFPAKRLCLQHTTTGPAAATILIPASPSAPLRALTAPMATPQQQPSSAIAAPTMDLFSLPDGCLIDYMRLLDCRTLLQVKRTCAAARPLVTEIVNTTASSSTFLSSAPSLTQAFSDLTARCLSKMSTPPSAVILFLSPSYPNLSLPAALAFLSSRLPPQCRLVGCQGIGILGRDCDTDAVRELERGERAVSMLMLHLPGVDVQAEFVDMKSLQQHLQDEDQETVLNPNNITDGALWLAERLSLVTAPSPSLAPSFVVLSSPVTTVSDVLDCLYQLSPTSTVTGALASGGRPPSIGLLTRQHDGKINIHTYGIVFLILTPKPTPPPSQSAAAADLLAEPSPSFPALSGLASRGCKACSGVYRIVTSTDDVISMVRQMQSLPEEDAQYDPLLHEEVMEQLVGGGSVNREDSGEGSDVSDGSESDEQEGSPTSELSARPSYTVGAPVVDVRAVLQQVMQRSMGQDGYINGLFIGISDEIESAEGRVLCDIVELQSTGIKIETSTFHAISHSRGSQSASQSPAPLSLQGKYMQLFELDPSACMVDLANRVRHLSRRSDVPVTTGSSPPTSSGSSLLPSALLFTCSGRGSEFYSRSNIDSSIVTHQSGLDVCGFCCNGEIGPPARSLQVHSWMQAEDRERRRQRRRAAADEARGAAASLDDNEANAHSLLTTRADESESSGLAADDALSETGGGLTCEPAVLQSYTAVVTTFNSHCR